MTTREKVPPAVAPVASVTVTRNVWVPRLVGLPSARPDGRRVRPAGSVPDHVYGAVPPVALNVVVKKLLTKTFLPGATSQTLPAQLMNSVSIASPGAVVPAGVVPVPLNGTLCGLFGALSVRTNDALRLPAFDGEETIETLQLAPGASVRPEQPSPTTVKSSVFGTAALLMNSEPLPLLVTATVCGALRVPVSCGPKVSALGTSETAGVVEVLDDGVQPESDLETVVVPSLTLMRHVGEL